MTLARRGVLPVAGPGFGGTFSGNPNSDTANRPQVPICRREDHRYDVPTQYIWNEEETEIIETIPGYTQYPDGIYEKSFYQLCDAQGSIVSVVTIGALPIDATRSYGAKQTVDWVEYDPYGRSRRWSKADHNMNGTLDAGDISGSFLNANFAADPSADQNENGTTNSTDIFAFLSDWFGGDTTARDWISHAAADNPYGYCGYYADKETLGINGVDNGFLYQCRYRVYDPMSGRWLQRDPAGSVDGMNLYEYVCGGSLGCVDPMGLSCDEEPRKQRTPAEILRQNERDFEEAARQAALETANGKQERADRAQQALDRQYNRQKRDAVEDAKNGAKMAIEVAGGYASNVNAAIEAIRKGDYAEAAKQIGLIVGAVALGVVVHGVGAVEGGLEGAAARAARSGENAGAKAEQAAVGAVKSVASEAQKVGEEIVQWLGKGAVVKRSDGKSFVILSKDGTRRFRIDFDGHGDVPHTHIEELENNKWRDATEVHRIPLKGTD